MKTIFITILSLMFTVPAFAASGERAFAIYSAASGAVKTSDAVNVRGWRTKTLTATGTTLTSNANSITFKNMSGTMIVEGAPSTNGPWSTLVQQDSTAVSLTSNGTLSWDDAVAYIRIKWTAATTGQKVKAFLNWLEN